MRAIRPLAGLAAPALAGGCAALDGRQSALSPGGPQAAGTYHFWWFALAVSVVVWVLVVGFALYGALHTPPDAGEPEAERARERGMTRWVAVAVAATVMTLLVYLGVDLALGRAQASLGRGSGETPLVIEVTGHQWWWEVRYADAQASRSVETANEIHIPVGRPVQLRMTSYDVIHSFWVPNLHGKKDLVPGHLTVTWLRADRAGVYRGQCAEFCGMQHAKMALLVVAEPPERFAAWYDRQLAPARPPATPQEARGQEVFLATRCVMCHTVRGTPAGGRAGPELTHLASRRTLGAATLPNTRGHLGGWVADPQRIKPGVKMPPNQLAPEELQALLDYLGSLR